MHVAITRCSTSDYIEVESPGVNASQSNLSLTVEYRWTASTVNVSLLNMTLDDDKQFSYRPDPVISDVQPLNHLYV